MEIKEKLESIISTKWFLDMKESLGYIPVEDMIEFMQLTHNRSSHWLIGREMKRLKWKRVRYWNKSTKKRGVAYVPEK